MPCELHEEVMSNTDMTWYVLAEGAPYGQKGGRAARWTGRAFEPISLDDARVAIAKECKDPKLEGDWKNWQSAALVLYHVEDPANWSDDQLRGLAEAFTAWDRVAVEYQIPFRFKKWESGDTGVLYIFNQGTPQQTDYAHTTLARTQPTPGVVLFARAIATDNENYLQSDAGFRKMALHEIGHTMGLKDRWGAKESSVMNQFSINPALPEQLGKRRDDPLRNILLLVTAFDAKMAKKSSER